MLVWWVCGWCLAGLFGFLEWFGLGLVWVCGYDGLLRILRPCGVWYNMGLFAVGRWAGLRCVVSVGLWGFVLLFVGGFPSDLVAIAGIVGLLRVLVSCGVGIT